MTAIDFLHTLADDEDSHHKFKVAAAALAW